MMPRPPSPSPAYSASFTAHNPSISAQYERRQKQRSIMGITAGAEDVKYQAKYRELKKKVKEIESVSQPEYGLPVLVPQPCVCSNYTTLVGQ